MIGLGAVYVFAGMVFGAIAVMSAADRENPKRWVNASFWGLFAASFLFGDFFGDFGNGLVVFAMAALAGFAGLGLGRPETTSVEERRKLAREFRNRLFVPALAIPLVTLIGSLTLKFATVGGRPLFSWPAFVPVTFELGVLSAVLVGIAGLLCLTGLPRYHHPVFAVAAFARASTDRFFLCLLADDPHYATAAVRALLEPLQPESIQEVPR